MSLKYVTVLLLFGFNLSSLAQEWGLINASDSLENYYIKTDTWPDSLLITSQYKPGDTLLLHVITSYCNINAFTQIMFAYGTDSIRAYRTIQHLLNDDVPISKSYGALPVALGKLWLNDYECEFANHCGGPMGMRAESFMLKGMYSGVLDSSCGYGNLIANFFPEPDPINIKRKRKR